MHRRKVGLRTRRCRTGKHTYRSEAKAWEAIHDMIVHRCHEPHRGELEPYRCRHCSGGIHVGHTRDAKEVG